MKVAVAGAGLIGRSWAIVFARGGHDVSLWDHDEAQPRRALESIATSLRDLENAGLIDSANAVFGRIAVAPTLAQAVANASHVQENVAERLEPKQQLFAEIESRVPPDAILASSTSAIMPSLIFGGLKSRHRCLVAHPMNPPHLAPFVELSGAEFTDAGTIAKTRSFMSSCRMSPITVIREIEGFVLNRLQHALLAEAFRLIANGYVSADDLDKALKDGLALRWSFMGPVETIDYNAPGGVADYMARYGETVRAVANPETSGPEWPADIGQRLALERRKLVPESRLAEAQAWRDRRLMALAAHKREAEKKFPR